MRKKENKPSKETLERMQAIADSVVNEPEEAPF
jgi:hypothetical protein